MADDVLKSLDVAVANFEQAAVAARAEHARLSDEVAGLLTQRASLTDDIRKLQQEKDAWDSATSVMVLRKCVEAGIDRYSIAELRKQLATHDAAAA